MKRIINTLLSLFITVAALAQGWPQNYDGIMLQGFYWGSYSDTKWTVLESQADELSQYFNLIWVPQSGYCNTLTNFMGYLPIWWFDHKSPFGTEAELRSMIKTFKQKGTGIIEDVVINHRNGNTNWCDIPTETWNGHTMTWSMADICRTDECARNGYSPTGAAESNTNDTDFPGGRDLDHSSPHVQENIKIYLDFLLNDLGYTGFRYDMVKGYAPKYTGIYNTSAKPEFSVGEFWDQSTSKVKGWVDGTKVDGVIQSAAFDFPMKYQINRAFQSGVWSSLNNSMLTTLAGYSRYSVTFVDNHDTGKNPANTSDGPLGKNIAAANAYILTMPGTPCVWLKHWIYYKGSIKRLIALRRAAGITNQSQILLSTSTANGFVLSVQGSKGSLLLVLGSATMPTGEWQPALEGTNYAVYASKDIDLTAVKAVTEEDLISEQPTVVDIPDFCTVADGELCAFFEAPSTWVSVNCWAWSSSPSDNFTFANKGWPGVTCTSLGTASNGNKVWKWKWDGTKQSNSAATQPTGIIFNYNGDANKTADLEFVNGGYYTINGLQGVVAATGIAAATTDRQDTGTAVYDLQGRRLKSPQKGINIINGKKLIVK